MPSDVLSVTSSRHYLPYDRGDLEYYDDSVVKMSQTAHDSAACQITRCGLEALRRHHLHVAHVIDRQPDLFGAELGEHDGPVVCARRPREPSRQIDYRDDGPAEVDQSADVRRGAREPGRMTDRNDLSYRRDVTAIHRARHREQQQSECACVIRVSRCCRCRSQSGRAGPGDSRARDLRPPPRVTV
jgi:hypothetical protein